MQASTVGLSLLQYLLLATVLLLSSLLLVSQQSCTTSTSTHISMSSSDETYLEAFIESLATLPHEVRRNMDLLKDLDASCAVEVERLQQLQRQYILAAEEKMLRLQVVEMVVDDDEDEEGDGDGVGDDSDASTGSTNNNPENNKAAPLSKYGVRVLNEDGSPSSNPKNDAAVVVPTTDELMAYTYQEHAETYTQIRRLQQTCLQKSDEKVAVARQAYERIDAQVQRLDADLVALESLLQAQGEYGYGTTSSSTAGGGGLGGAGAGGAVVAKPNDLAACQVTPGSEWILAKVIRHDPGAGIYTLADEDVESNKSKRLACDACEYCHCNFSRRLTLLLVLSQNFFSKSLTCPNSKSLCSMVSLTVSPKATSSLRYIPTRHRFTRPLSCRRHASNSKAVATATSSSLSWSTLSTTVTNSELPMTRLSHCYISCRRPTMRECNCSSLLVFFDGCGGQKLWLSCSALVQ